MWVRLRQFFRLTPPSQPLECSSPFTITSFQFSASTPGGADNVNEHRFAENINGRDYLIEVSSVGVDKWRAQIARVPGGSAATDAVLREDSRRGRRTTEPLARTRARRQAILNPRIPQHNAAADCAILTSVPDITRRHSFASLAALSNVSDARAERLSARGPSERPRRPAPLPKVRLIATGGTISNRTGGRLTSDELVASMPRHRAIRPRRVGTIRQHVERRADARPVAGARPPHQRPLRGGSRRSPASSSRAGPTRSKRPPIF